MKKIIHLLLIFLYIFPLYGEKTVLYLAVKDGSICYIDLNDPNKNIHNTGIASGAHPLTIQEDEGSLYVSTQENNLPILTLKKIKETEKFSLSIQMERTTILGKRSLRIAEDIHPMILPGNYCSGNV